MIDSRIFNFLSLCVSALSLASVKAGSLVILVQTNEPMPDGNGKFGGRFDYGVPYLNDRGTVLFSAGVDDAAFFSDDALILARPGSRTVLARTRQFPPVLAGIEDERFVGFGEYSLSGGGVTCFSMNPKFNASSYGIMSSGASGSGYGLSMIPGAASPDEGNLALVSNRPINTNTTGTAAFSCRLTGTDGGSVDDFGVFIIPVGTSSLTPIAQSGDPVPSSSLTYNLYESFAPTVNDSNQVAMVVGLLGGSNGDEGILRGDGTNLVLMAASGDGLPGGGSIDDFGPVGSVPINASGVIATAINSDGGSALEVVGRIDSPGSVTEVARSGSPVSGLNYTYREFDRHLELNDQGDVAYLSSMTPVLSGDPILEGIFVNQTVIAYEGQSLPQGLGEFEDVDDCEFSLNSSGEVAFQCNLFDGGGTQRRALFFYSPGSGVEEVIRVGDPLLGSTVSDVFYSGTNANNGSVPACRSGFNDAGQIAFLFRLDDNRAGIALWSAGALPSPLPGPQLARTSPTTATIEFSGFVGVPYVIEASQTLEAGSWTDEMSSFLFGPTGSSTYLIDLLDTRRFFRTQPLYHQLPYSN